MSGHTPGPWAYEYENADYSGGGCWYAIKGPDGGDLLWYPYNGPRSGGEREEANARLMAAAPELLALAVALETAIREGLIRNAYDEDSAGVLADFAREAIAKAGAA